MYGNHKGLEGVLVQILENGNRNLGSGKSRMEQLVDELARSHPDPRADEDDMHNSSVIMGRLSEVIGCPALSCLRGLKAMVAWAHSLSLAPKPDGWTDEEHEKVTSFFRAMEEDYRAGIVLAEAAKKIDEILTAKIADYPVVAEFGKQLNVEDADA